MLSKWYNDGYDRIEEKGVAFFMEIDAMTKMWISFLAIGLMVAASVLITFARAKTKGIVRIILSVIALICLLLALLYGFISIL